MSTVFCIVILNTVKNLSILIDLSVGTQRSFDPVGSVGLRMTSLLRPIPNNFLGNIFRNFVIMRENHIKHTAPLS